MGCCGQKRAALRTAAVATPPDPAPRSVGSDPLGVRPSSDSEDASRVVEYQGDGAVLVRVTGGRLYTFSPGRRARSIPAPDAEQLLRNPLFRLDERRSNGTEQERT
jgi:hypothetical protein